MRRCSSCHRENSVEAVTCTHCGSALDQAAIAPVLASQIKDLLSNGQKIEAVKRYREATSAGLKEAKDVVELIERGEVPERPPSVSHDDRFLHELTAMVQDGRKIEAIKRYRHQTGADLKAAKDFVDSLTPNDGGYRSGCLGLVLLLLAVSVSPWWLVVMSRLLP